MIRTLRNVLGKNVLGCAVLASAAGMAFGADVGTGIQQFNDKQYAQAESTLREVVSAEPDNADANLYLGKALVEEKKYAESVEFLKKAADAKPEAHIALGDAYLMQDKIDDALHELDMAEQADAKTSDLYLYRGMAYLKRDKAADAAKALDESLKIDAKNAYAHYYMGLAQNKLKRPDLMLQHFETFLQLAPNAPEASRVKALLRSQ